MINTGLGLVLEGGGMRGVYTAGALDCFLKNNLKIPYVIGVSAGACNGASYVSQQSGRSKKINIDYIKDPRYLSYRNFLFNRSIFGMEFLFHDIPYKLEPFDFERFFSPEQRFIIGVTDCHSGKPAYFEISNFPEKTKEQDVLRIMQASSSLPFVSRVVEYKGETLLDGGISDPIPIKKSLQDGNAKNIVILTRNKDYRKKPFKNSWLAKRLYPNYKGLIEAMMIRHQVYNDTLDFLEQMEAEGKVFLIRPRETHKVDRLERNQEKLTRLYDKGFTDTEEVIPKLRKWLEL